MRLILKKIWLSDIEILKICGPVNHEEHVQEEHSTRTETQNIENQIMTERSSTPSILTKEDRTNAERIKKITSK